MKKHIIKTVSLAVFAAVVLSTTVNAQTATTTSSAQVNAFLAQLQILRDLRQGMSGDDVKILQSVLAAHPDIYPEGIVTGYYGALTAKAVAKYQKKYGISAVGKVGPMTRGHLNKLLSELLDTTSGTSTVASACIKIPPGHFIAPGQLKKNNGIAPAVPACQKLPPGILKKLGLGTTTATTTLDVTAPVISSVFATSTTASTTQVMWTTNELATSKIVYSTSTPVVMGSMSQTLVMGGFRTNHSLPLNMLTSTSTYYYVVVSSDFAGNTSTSTQTSFTTI